MDASSVPSGASSSALPTATAASPTSSAAQSVSITDATIFVSIISYRDPETRHTLESLYSRASHPDRVFVGVVWQFDPAADSQLLFDGLDLTRYPAGHVRQLFIPHTQAKGPCYARYLAQTQLYGGGTWWKPHGAAKSASATAAEEQKSDADVCDASGCEDFYLQLDSHMRMADGWDDQLISQWRACEDERAVLSAYPPGYEQGSQSDPADANSNTFDAPPLMCASHFDSDDGMVRFVGRLLNPTPRGQSEQRGAAAGETGANSSSTSALPSTPTPTPSLFYAAGFAFGPGSMVRLCPYDPHLCNLFFGEEMSLLARLWTSGFNLYSPATNLVWHCWSRSYRPSFRENIRGVVAEARRESIARRRVQTMLGMSVTPADQALLAPIEADQTVAQLLVPSAPYGLGSARTLSELESHLGIDFGRRTLSSRAANGGLSADRFKPVIKKTQMDLIMQFVQQRTSSSAQQ